MNQTLSTFRTGRVRTVEVEEMYLPEPGNWPSISGNNGVVVLDNPPKEAIAETSQIREKNLTILKLLYEEVRMFQQKHLKP